MKKCIQICRMIVVMILFCNIVFCNTIMINAKNIVNISFEYLGFSPENSIKDMKKLAKEIGGMKKKENSKHKYYVSGQKIKIKVNEKASVRENESYIYIYNGGNKNVRLLGMKIGMSKEKAAETLREAGLYEGEKNTFWWGDAGCVKIKLKKGKVIEYSYECSPTS